MELVKVQYEDDHGERGNIATKQAERPDSVSRDP